MKKSVESIEDLIKHDDLLPKRKNEQELLDRSAIFEQQHKEEQQSGQRSKSASRPRPVSELFASREARGRFSHSIGLNSAINLENNFEREQIIKQ